MKRRAVEIANHFIFPSKPYKFELVGSVARGDDYPHDIDYLITVSKIQDDYLSKIRIEEPYEITDYDACGVYNCYFKIKLPQKRKILINLFLTNKKDYVYAKIGRRLDKGHLIHYKKLANQKGLRLTNNGLFNLHTGKRSNLKFTCNTLLKYLDSPIYNVSN